MELPDVPAIYFAVSEVDEVLYVGRALSLRARWRGTHHRKAELEEAKDVRIYWLVCEATELTQKETGFIEVFDPPLNGIAVPPLDVGKWEKWEYQPEDPAEHVGPNLDDEHDALIARLHD